MEIEIGPYKVSQRTSYSKILTTDNQGNLIDSKIGEKIIEDYKRQTQNPKKYFKISENTLDYYEDIDKLEYIFVPEGIVNISSNAFEKSSFSFINLPNTLKSIGIQAFANCEKLKEVNLPNSVIALNECSFYSCTSLRKITLPNRLTNIPEFAFNWCDVLDDLVLPDNIRGIDNGAFNWCKNLTKINIPGNIEFIGRNVFRNSGIKTLIFNQNIKDSPYPSASYGNFAIGTKINRIEISKNVTHIDPNFFKYTNCITELDYCGNESEFENFKKNNEEFLKTLKEIEINIENDLGFLINKDTKMFTTRGKINAIEI